MDEKTPLLPSGAPSPLESELFYHLGIWMCECVHLRMSCACECESCVGLCELESCGVWIVCRYEWCMSCEYGPCEGRCALDGVTDELG